MCFVPPKESQKKNYLMCFKLRIFFFFFQFRLSWNKKNGYRVFFAKLTKKLPVSVESVRFLFHELMSP